MIPTLRTLTRVAVAALTATALTPLTSAAQDADVLNACVSKNLGLMRLLAPGGTCKPTETPVSWNVQGPAGPSGPVGPQGPAGPQYALSASVRSDGSLEALTAPPGATLTVARQGPGAWLATVTGLGTGCPLPTATAFSAPVTMWLGPGSCGGGTLSILVYAGNGSDVTFILSVIGQAPVQGMAKQARTQAPKMTIGGN